MYICVLWSATRGSKLSLGHQMTSQQTQHYSGASLRYNTQHKTTEDLKQQSLNTKKRCAGTDRDRAGSGFFGLLWYLNFWNGCTFHNSKDGYETMHFTIQMQVGYEWSSISFEATAIIMEFHLLHPPQQQQLFCPIQLYHFTHYLKSPILSNL
jgi:hypothetical protein